MRYFFAVLTIATLAAPLAARQGMQGMQGMRGMQHDPDKKIEGGGTLPAGWQARLDHPDAKLDALKFVETGGTFHATTGPAGIFYKDSMSESGPFEVQATFTQTKPSMHPEAYGLIIGGSDLQGPKQQYTYFLVRQDGKFLIKRRNGAETPTVMPWTDHASIKRADAAGSMTNMLAITVARDKVHFRINGTEVASEPLGSVDASGIVGLRVNHNLDVEIAGFAVKSAMGR